MLTTEIQQDTYTGPVTLNPRWLRIPSAVKYSGLSRSRLYELLAQGRIRSICLKSHNKALRGVRLVDRESIDLFMVSLSQVVLKPINCRCVRSCLRPNGASGWTYPSSFL